MPITLTYDDYLSHSDRYDGYCRNCAAITRVGDTEPDAEGYECPTCGEMSCYGIEQAVLHGFIEIEEVTE